MTNLKSDDLSSEQRLQLTMLFAQQDILNQIILDYNNILHEKEDQMKQPTSETIIELMRAVVNNINTKQLTIDSSIKQIQNDITARLN